jgi:hypothetical protein
MHVANPDSAVKRQEPGQWVDGPAVLQVADHGHRLAGHRAQLATNGKDVQQSLKFWKSVM